MHHRHEVPLNPLYKRGHERVGCFPCIYARKEEIRLISEFAPERIDEVRDLESGVARIRAERNAERPGRYPDPGGTFFQGRTKRSGFVPIDEVVTWSKTDRGGRQLPLLATPPTGGCMRWGLCEPPPDHNEQGDS